MSFWEQEAWTPQHRGSIENILKSDEPTLVKLLDDDELVAEVSNLHDGLLLFLSRQELLQELLGWMLGCKIGPQNLPMLKNVLNFKETTLTRNSLHNSSTKDQIFSVTNFDDFQEICPQKHQRLQAG